MPVGRTNRRAAYGEIHREAAAPPDERLVLPVAADAARRRFRLAQLIMPRLRREEPVAPPTERRVAPGHAEHPRRRSRFSVLVTARFRREEPPPPPVERRVSPGHSEHPRRRFRIAYAIVSRVRREEPPAPPVERAIRPLVVRAVPRKRGITRVLEPALAGQRIVRSMVRPTLITPRKTVRRLKRGIVRIGRRLIEVILAPTQSWSMGEIAVFPTWSFEAIHLEPTFSPSLVWVTPTWAFGEIDLFPALGPSLVSVSSAFDPSDVELS